MKTHLTQVERVYMEIMGEDKNAILKSEDLSNYNITYKPDKFIIDVISKGGGKQGYIRFKNSDKYEKFHIL